MKKFVVAILTLVMTFMCVVFVGCNKSENVKVFKNIKLTEETYAFAIKKENTALKTSVDELLSAMKEDNSLEELINSYFDGTATFTYENPESEEGCFVVATNAYFPPFEYYEGNKFKGIDIEIASLIAEKLNKTLYIKDMEFDSIVNSVKSGESDIGMAGMTVNAERLKQVDFSIGYYESAQVITVKESDTDFDDCKTTAEVEEVLKTKDSKYIIGAQNGTTGYMYSFGDDGFGYVGFKNLTTQGYKTGALAMKDLSNGKINAVILDLQPSLMIAENINSNE